MATTSFAGVDSMIFRALMLENAPAFSASVQSIDESRLPATFTARQAMAIGTAGVVRIV